MSSSSSIAGPASSCSTKTQSSRCLAAGVHPNSPAYLRIAARSRFITEVNGCFATTPPGAIVSPSFRMVRLASTYCPHASAKIAIVIESSTVVAPSKGTTSAQTRFAIGDASHDGGFSSRQSSRAFAASARSRCSRSCLSRDLASVLPRALSAFADSGFGPRLRNFRLPKKSSKPSREKACLGVGGRSQSSRDSWCPSPLEQASRRSTAPLHTLDPPVTRHAQRYAVVLVER